jgi:hypothetical protein
MAKLTKLLTFITLFFVSLSANAAPTIHGATNVLGATSPDLFFEGYTFLDAGTVIDDIFMFNIAGGTIPSILATTATSNENPSGALGIADFKFALTDHMGTVISDWGMSGESVSFHPVGTPATTTYGVYYTGTVSGWYAGAIGEVTSIAPVPVPAAAYLFGSALIGLFSVSRSRKATV